MKFLLLVMMSLYAVGAEYYAKAEPYRAYLIQSNVSGLVIKADENLEGKLLSSTPFVIIDSDLDRKELAILQEKRKHLVESLSLNEKSSENLRLIIEKKNANYERIKDLKIKSSIEKDKEFFDLTTTQNQQLSTLEKIETLKSSLRDTDLRISQLQRAIADKRFSANGKLLYSLMVKKNQVVSVGANIAKVFDISKAKLTLYLSQSELEAIGSKKIYLNSQKTNYKIDKIWSVTDEEHISAYRTEIIIDAPKMFSQLYTIEFK